MALAEHAPTCWIPAIQVQGGGASAWQQRYLTLPHQRLTKTNKQSDNTRLSADIRWVAQIAGMPFHFETDHWLLLNSYLVRLMKVHFCIMNKDKDRILTFAPTLNYFYFPTFDLKPNYLFPNKNRQPPWHTLRAVSIGLQNSWNTSHVFIGCKGQRETVFTADQP